ncbi:MAG: PAS domain S-box protein [Anaerolineae bacterium]|nr:PAS domain S-box protein [Anaerolineae bacterium]
MLFQFSPIIPVYALVAVLMLYLSARTWNLRPARGASAWSMTLLFCAIHTLGTCLEIAFATPVLKLAMNRVIYVGTTGFVFFWGIFAIQYSNHGRWLNRVTLPLLAIVPACTLVLALFAEQHHLLYRAYEFVYLDGLLLGQVAAYGALFYLWVTYSYIVFVSSWLLLLLTAIRSQAIFRNQIWLVILASAVPMITYVLQLFGLKLYAPYYPLAFAMAFAGVIMLLAMTRLRFGDILPVAYDQIFRNVKGGIILLDLKGRVAGLNHAAERILGSSEKDVLWKEARDAFPEQRHLIKQFEYVNEIKTEVAMSAVGPFYELQITPLTSHHGEPAGRVVMFYDITERKQIEQKTLELTVEQERVAILRQFISHMSHDLRTPLAILKLTEYALRNDLKGQLPNRVDMLEKQTDRLIEMVESMLTMLRLEGEKLDSLGAVDMNELICTVIERHRLLAQERGTQLQFNRSQELPFVVANRDELLLALSNLVVNAIHYSSGGEIIMDTAHDQESVVISVCDSGIGISAEHLPHIFERFYRVDDARGTQNGGLGLGLTITKTIVERHAGTIDVQSQLGEGSQFSIRLPLEQAS